MVVSKIAENVLGAIGMVCWTLQVMPQIWKSYRSKSTDGLSEWFILMWGFSGSLRGIYLIAQKLNIPLMLQPHVLILIYAISWTQCLYYGRKWSLKRCVLCCAAYLVLVAGFEVGMIYALKPAARQGNTIPVKLFSITSSAITALGLLPQYWEIYKRKEVVGLSIAFMTVNIGGGVFSFLSLVFKEKFDVFASTTFVIIVIMDMVIIAAALILNPIARRRRAARTSALVQVVEVPSVNILTGGIGSSDSAGESDLELGKKPTGSGNLAEV